MKPRVPDADPPVVEYEIPDEPDPVRSDLPVVERLSRSLIGYAWGLLGLLVAGLAFVAHDTELRVWLVSLAGIALLRIAFLQWRRARRRAASESGALKAPLRSE